MQRFRSGLVCRAHSLGEPLNSKLESDNEEKKGVVVTVSCSVASLTFRLKSNKEDAEGVGVTVSCSVASLTSRLESNK